MKLQTTHAQYRPDIDGLRAIAVISVIGFHYFPQRVSGGYIGVDIFFVISGYLISQIILKSLRDDTFSLFDFYARRIKRIFPSLIVVMLSCFAIGWFTLLGSEFSQLGKHIATGAVFLSNFTLASEAGYFDSASYAKPFLHLWSLGIEEQFYIVFPVLLWYASQRKFKILSLLGLILCASFAYNLIETKLNLGNAFYSPFSRAWELLIGGCLAIILNKDEAVYSKTLHRLHQYPKLLNLLSVFGIAILLAGNHSLTRDLNFPGAWALIPIIGTSLLILAGPNTWFNQHILANRALRWLGLISFPMYLWHWPILSIYIISFTEFPSGATLFMMLIVTTFLSWLSYRFLEIPIRRSHTNKPTIALISIMVASLVVACLTFANDGWPSRSINAINATLNATKKYDWQPDFRSRTCFVDENEEDYIHFAPECSYENPQLPSVVLWGDSFAASLYQGLLTNSKKQNFNLIQQTASGCPPIIGFHVSKRSACQRINNEIAELIKKLKPRTVLLAANWSLYNGERGWEEIEFNKLEMTISRLQKLGVRHIVLVGQLPLYWVDQVDMLRKHSKEEKPTFRTYKNFNTRAFEVTEKLFSIAARTNVHFIDPLRFLCTPDGCQLSIDKDGLIPLSYDSGHLTKAGSEYLMTELFNANMIPIRED